jgi:hypothetical protein
LCSNYELIGRNFQRTPDEDESRAASSVVGCCRDSVPVDEVVVAELGLVLALAVLPISAADGSPAGEVIEAGTEAVGDADDDMSFFPLL